LNISSSLGAAVVQRNTAAVVALVGIAHLSLVSRQAVAHPLNLH
jgi:hypothetical protein